MSEEYFHQVSVATLDDLACRFLLNIPQSARKDPIRVCFAIEQAYWFYKRFSSEEQRGETVKEFAAHLFRHVPYLRAHSRNVDDILERWLEYKISIPTYGAIILNRSSSKITGVNGCWGFPKGKINEEENISDCAVREVLEETGLDISGDLEPEQYVEEVIGGQTLGLFIVTDYNENIRLKPRSVGEIRSIKWFSLASLPRDIKDKTCLQNTGYHSGSFYWVVPFLTKLESFIQEKENSLFRNEDEELMKSLGLPTKFSGRLVTGQMVI